MNLKDVAKLSPEERFTYWIKERHQIYLKRKTGKSPPWTDDEVLQNYFFTNPYRENDKTTVWFRENVREPMRDNPDVLLATVIFRWFNLIETGKILWNFGTDQDGVADLLTRWNSNLVLNYLGRERDKGNKIFTGAFMISSPGGEPKLEAICRRIDNVWKDRHDLIHSWHEGVMVEDMHRALCEYEGLGGFMAYEIVCDLRYTYLLEHATDIMTWCNPGPGCCRGLARINDQQIKSNSIPKLPNDWLHQMTELLKLCNQKLRKMPRFEMREIEHSLCEWDKYERIRLCEGPSKRKYNGRGDAQSQTTKNRKI